MNSCAPCGGRRHVLPLGTAPLLGVNEMMAMDVPAGQPLPSQVSALLAALGIDAHGEATLTVNAGPL